MPEQPTLKRDLGVWGAIAIVVGTVIGSGIFLVPKTMINNVGSPAMLFFVWVFGGLLSLFGALTYAELAAAMPEAGGEYVYLREAYGPLFGFIYGWTQTWVAKAASIATLATGFFTYFANFVPVLETVLWRIDLPIGPHGGPLEIRYGQLLAIATVILLAIVNYFGVKIGGGVQVAVTVLKVALIAAIICVGMFLGKGTFSHYSETIPSVGGASGFFAALVAALWAYDGWNNVVMVASEIKRPQRNLPLALIGGTLLVVIIYILTNVAYFYILHPAEVGQADRVASEMMRHILGTGGAAWVSLAAMISIFAALNGSILSGARVPYATARDGLLFKGLATVHPTHHTPSVAIIVLSLWSCLIVLTGRYDDLFNLVIFSSWILYTMTAVSVIVLRKKRPDMDRPYRTLGYPYVPIAFVLVALALLAQTLIDRPRESLFGLGIIIVGLPFYFYWKRRLLVQ